MPRKKKQAKPRERPRRVGHCNVCDEPITRTGRPDALYCSKACRGKAKEQRRCSTPAKAARRKKTLAEKARRYYATPQGRANVIAASLRWQAAQQEADPEAWRKKQRDQRRRFRDENPEKAKEQGRQYAKKHDQKLLAAGVDPHKKRAEYQRERTAAIKAGTWRPYGREYDPDRSAKIKAEQEAAR